MTTKRTKKTSSITYASGATFVGAVVLGLGVGMIKQEVALYTLLGAGAGCALLALIYTTSKPRS